MKHQAIHHKLPSRQSTRKGVELSAIAYVLEELSRIPRVKSHDRDMSARWSNQSCHKVHESCLSRSIRTNKRRNPRRNSQGDPIYAENLAVKLGYILEDDSIVHPLTTSRARMRAFNIATQMKQARISIIAIDSVDREYLARKASGAPTGRCQRSDIITGILSK